MTTGALEKIILVAMTEDGVIGRGNALPWHLPEELRLFRELTLGHPVIMGRRTLEAIGRPLPERRNLVLSRTLSPAAGVEICRDFDAALRLAASAAKVFFIGGREVFARALPIADVLRVSWIAGDYPGDVFFPKVDWERWKPVEEVEGTGFRHVAYWRREP
jgi:dihydrofolate reductase